MRIARLLTTLASGASFVAIVSGLISCTLTPHPVHDLTGADQVPAWSQDDMNFFLHGSMSTEVVPEAVLRAFFETYPDLYPTRDFSHIGALPDPAFGWPVGFSRGRPAHLASLSSVGINCAVCHTSDIRAPGERKVRVLGAPGVFDVESFFGSIAVATFRTQDPANMKKFLLAYLDECDPQPLGDRTRRRSEFEAAWQKQAVQISASMAEDPSGARGAGPGGLQSLSSGDFQFTGKELAAGPDLRALSVNMLKLFHNMRVALHIPDQPPTQGPPPSGPGRNDAFGSLSASLFNSPQPFAPVKFGIIWNVSERQWVHWDGNTPSPIARNILATLGLGAPLVGHEGRFDLKLVQRQTAITEHILPPKYPYAIDLAASRRGKAYFDASCVACHDGTYGDDRLYSPDVVKTDSTRASLFTSAQADGFNTFMANLQTPGYTPPADRLRSTGKYYAPSLAGVWARSPYLHNGSVRTMEELLTPAALRAGTFHRGATVFDPTAMGFVDQGSYLFDTRSAGNSNAGHEYGTQLTPAQRRDLIEFLKTL